VLCPGLTHSPTRFSLYDVLSCEGWFSLTFSPHNVNRLEVGPSSIELRKTRFEKMPNCFHSSRPLSVFNSFNDSIFRFPGQVSPIDICAILGKPARYIWLNSCYAASMIFDKGMLSTYPLRSLNPALHMISKLAHGTLAGPSTMTSMN
jgi:hypothetical protein